MSFSLKVIECFYIIIGSNFLIVEGEDRISRGSEFIWLYKGVSLFSHLWQI